MLLHSCLNLIYKIFTLKKEFYNDNFDVSKTMLHHVTYHDNLFIWTKFLFSIKLSNVFETTGLSRIM